MKILFLFLLTSTISVAQSLTFPALKQLKEVAINDHIQIPDAQIVYPVTGLATVKVKQEYSPMGEIKYLEIELWVVDARGIVVYSYVTTSTDLKNQIIDQDYVGYMNTQGHKMKHKRL